MENFVRVAAVEDLSPGSTLLLTDFQPPVTLVRDLAGDFHAIDDACPHVGASLVRGVIHEDAVIECPLHHGLWCLRTGEAKKYPARVPATIHHVEVRDGGVWLPAP